MVAQNVAFGIIAAAMALGALGVVRTKNVVHAALYLVVVLGGGAAQFILLGQEFVAWARNQNKAGKTVDQAAAEYKLPDK